ncbi:MAG: L-threonylcarbamoyladenylate synthase [Deltaproteobacteria bacterium]|nr:L-threonylcarbamoyladenylate synthase [Deltaproteobacteria bacterium]
MAARVLPPTPENIAAAARALAASDVVGMPTETVYGLAGSVFDPAALAKIFDVKERPRFDPLIVHVTPAFFHAEDFKDASAGAAGPKRENPPTAAPIAAAHPILRCLARIGLVKISAMPAAAQARAETLARAFWPGPLTLVLPKLARVPDLATSGLSTVAVRMPRHGVAQELIRAAGVPLAAPSANRFGHVSPTEAAHVAAELGDRIALILDGGPCEVGLESTVLRVENDASMTLLRPGGVDAEEIEAATGAAPKPVAASSKEDSQAAGAARHAAQTPAARAAASSSSRGMVASPGMLDSHYAPAKPLYLLPCRLEDLCSPENRERFDRVVSAVFAKHPELGTHPRAGLLVQRGDPDWSAALFVQIAQGLVGKPVAVRGLSLSLEGNVFESAHGLFSRIRELDASDAAILFAEPCYNKRGIGFAIADRLCRAATAL